MHRARTKIAIPMPTPTWLVAPEFDCWSQISPGVGTEAEFDEVVTLGSVAILCGVGAIMSLIVKWETEE